jgi:hypothetical protein
MAPLATRRRTFRIRQDPTRAKSDWVYTELEVMALYDVSRNTIPSWIKAGLRAVPARGRRLFLGADLNHFHKERRERAKRRPERDELYCIACKAQQSMTGREVVLLSRRPQGSGWLHWACPECSRVTALPVSSLQIERLSNHGVYIASAKTPTE